MPTAIVTVDAGLDILMPPYFVANDVKLKLFVNDYTPLRTSTAGAFTEAAGGGYALKTLTANTHTVQTATTPHDINWGSQAWTFTGALTTNPTIYGYYVTNSAGTTVLWAQRLDSAFTPANNGDTLTIDPTRIQYAGGIPA